VFYRDSFTSVFYKMEEKSLQKWPFLSALRDNGNSDFISPPNRDLDMSSANDGHKSLALRLQEEGHFRLPFEFVRLRFSSSQF